MYFGVFYTWFGVADVKPTMSQTDGSDILNGILEAMEETHGSIMNAETGGNMLENVSHPEPATREAEDSARVPATTGNTSAPAEENSQISQLTLAITSLTQNFQTLQQQQLALTQNLANNTSEPPPLTREKVRGKERAAPGRGTRLRKL